MSGKFYGCMRHKHARGATLSMALAALTSIGCGARSDDQLDSASQAAVDAPSLADSCGYEVTDGTYGKWPNGYQAWVELHNVEGATGVDFEVLVDVGNTTIVDGYQAEYAEADGGYSVTAPSWLQWQKIRTNQRYRFAFIGQGTYDDVTPYVISINGERCDTVPPVVSLNVSQELFTSEGSLTLTAEARDNVAVRKVVFELNGEVLGEDWEPPYTLDIEIDDSLNGRNVFTATAVDPSENVGTDSEKVFVAIGNRFLGTATGAPKDYDHLLSYFGQLTPENAGKWGWVEAERDTMVWDELDEAYQFAKDNGLPFKLHTLIWGQQQPAWLASLSTSEQLEEIEEWIAALAARYPDVEMVDVVNEPMHAPPDYAATLGGAGETGFDWIVASFELAREYFPNAQLLLNDYNVLILESFTADYLQIVDVLHERDLIDGIGVQAHFLERADLDVVETNLDSLAATGLPIYVSEFDVNFADDARHANRLAELFSIFWSNPSVVGVTHWGHLEGSVWQADAYLVRTDDTTRPGLDWLMCTIGGGEDCPLPEYVPAPWVGDEYGLDLEAEDFDTQQGLVALGGSVAYTDDGDWLSFAAVQFEESWDKFYVTYAKGNTEVGSVSLHIDSLEAPAAVELELPPTAGWGSNETVEVQFAPISGLHTIYLVFHDTYGVANVDALGFIGPPPPPGTPISQADFETGLDGWFSWSGTPVLDTEHAHSGNQSLRLTGRTTGSERAIIDLTSLVSQGRSYEVNLWARLDDPANEGAQANLNLTKKLSCVNVDDPADVQDSYTWIGGQFVVGEDEWVEYNSAFDTNCADGYQLSEVLVWVEGAGAGIDFLLDDVQFFELPQDQVSADFESGTDMWFSWAGTVLSTADHYHGGSRSLLLTDRNSGSERAIVDLTAFVELNASYDFSLWVSVLDVDANINVTKKLSCVNVDDPDDRQDSYVWIGGPVTVPGGDWTQISGQFDTDCEVGYEVAELLVWVEGAPAGVDVYVDDALFTKAP